MVATHRSFRSRWPISQAVDPGRPCRAFRFLAPVESPQATPTSGAIMDIS
jgi:hypothetical protein